MLCGQVWWYSVAATVMYLLFRNAVLTMPFILADENPIRVAPFILYGTVVVKLKVVTPPVTFEDEQITFLIQYYAHIFPKTIK